MRKKIRNLKLYKLTVTYLLIAGVLVGNLGISANAMTLPTIWYCTHVQDKGWTPTVTNGALSGTTGQSKRVEAIQIDLSGISGGVTYRTHVQDHGWLGWVTNRQTSGTTGQSKRVEAIQIKLTGEAANRYSVRYRVHVQDHGWLDWVSNGATAGTTGQSKRVEAIQITLTPKSGGSSNEGSSSNGTSSSASVLDNSKVNSFINDDRWKVGTTFTNSVTCKIAGKGLGYGCNAYARDFVKYVYGKGLYEGTKYTNISELKAGDTVYVTPQHWMIILKRTGNQVDVIHGNWTNGKVCRSQFAINGNKIGDKKTFSYGYHY